MSASLDPRSPPSAWCGNLSPFGRFRVAGSDFSQLSKSSDQWRADLGRRHPIGPTVPAAEADDDSEADRVPKADLRGSRAASASTTQVPVPDRGEGQAVEHVGGDQPGRHRQADHQGDQERDWQRARRRSVLVNGNGHGQEARQDYQRQWASRQKDPDVQRDHVHHDQP